MVRDMHYQGIPKQAISNVRAMNSSDNSRFRYKFPNVFSGYITVCFTPTKDGFEKYYNEPAVDKGFWEPHLDTDYDSEEIQVSLLYV